MSTALDQKPGPQGSISLDWTPISEQVLPAHLRERFADEAERTARWVEPNGMHPMSPGLGLELVIKEFDIKPVVGVSYSGMWEARDDNGELEPRVLDGMITYSILGVATRRQRLYFLDGGLGITPVLLVSAAKEDTP